MLCLRSRRSRCLLLVAAFAALTLAACGGSKIRRTEPPVYFPAFPDEPRIQFLLSVTSEVDIGEPSAFEKFVVGEDEEIRALVKPYGVALEWPRMYVTDTRLGTIVVVDFEKGTFEPFMGARGAGAVQKPINIEIAPDGTRYVADAGRELVLVYNRDDEFVRAFGGKEQFRPSDILVWKDRLYVCDVRDGEIEVLKRSTGELLFKFGARGSEPGQLFFPTNLAQASDGTIYVSDTGNFRVQKFTPEGELLGGFGQIGDTYGTFTRPKGIAIDPDDRIYVVDSAFENVQIFDVEERLLAAFGGPGAEPGNLWLPADIEITDGALEQFQPYASDEFKVQHLVLVVSQYGPRRINIFGFGTFTGTLPSRATETEESDAEPSESAPGPAEDDAAASPEPTPTAVGDEPEEVLPPTTEEEALDQP